MTIQSERLTITPLAKEHIESLLALEVKNRDFFKAFAGTRRSRSIHMQVKQNEYNVF
ncbi:hypothetical protein ACFSGI_18065 [Paenibacillus nicotianae]|uniref:Uncharacterized protein n=1 Tax=Paenibacillus nicotianae TaxID=1526551 RepID=A0ABW4UXZ8_9BACL